MVWTRLKRMQEDSGWSEEEFRYFKWMGKVMDGRRQNTGTRWGCKRTVNGLERKILTIN